MLRTSRTLSLFLGSFNVTLAAALAPAHANPYDDCILEHMGTAQNEAAAHSIQRACISKSSISITRTFDPTADLNAMAWPGNYNTGYIDGWKYGLLVRIKNLSTFNITELVVIVRDQKTNKTNEYVVSDFDEPLNGPGLISKEAEPAYRNIIPVGKTRAFLVPATEVTEDAINDFFKRFTWNLRLSKGIPSETPIK
jgi:hypothetical protein